MNIYWNTAFWAITIIINIKESKEVKQICNIHYFLACLNKINGFWETV